MDDTDYKVDFMLEVSVRRLFFNPGRKEGLVFKIDEGQQHEIFMRPADYEDDPFGSHRMKCGIVISVSCSKDDYNFIENIIESVFTPFKGMPIYLPYIKDGVVKLDAEGKLTEGYKLPIEGYPKDVQDLIDEISVKMESRLNRFLKILRWSQDADSDAEPFEYPELYWKTRQEVYHYCGFHRNEGRASTIKGIVWDAEDSALAKTLWDEEHNEPLAHQLLREAKDSINKSMRSALLMTATSLEVGVKQHISHIAPQASWLAANMPTPPVHKLLRDAIPAMHALSGNPIEFWQSVKPLILVCGKLFEDRNSLAHAGKFDITFDKINSYIDTASDILYILDTLIGHEWARGMVSYETAQKLGWATKRKGFIVSVLSHDL